MSREYPILEFDNARRAVIEPSEQIKPIGLPEHAVLCFFREVLEKLQHEHDAEQAGDVRSELCRHPVLTVRVGDGAVAVVHPGVGAPYAAAVLEEMIALGSRKFIVCGGAGVLNSAIAAGHLVVPRAAVRDEGTSYHYAAPSREIEADPAAVAAIEQVLTARGVPYVTGKTWTTDAFYRETPGKVARRRDEGCLTVEMEAAAFFAVAQFRGVPLGQILYGGDDVGGPEWDQRGWQTRADVRESLFWLAAEACLLL